MTEDREDTARIEQEKQERVNVNAAIQMEWWERLNALTARLGGLPGDKQLDVIERAALRLESLLSSHRFFDDSWGGCICNLGTEGGAFTGVHSALCVRMRGWAADLVLCERAACAKVAEQTTERPDDWDVPSLIAKRIRERNPDEVERIQWKLSKRKVAE